MSPTTFDEFFSTAAITPNGVNVGYFSDPKLDAVLNAARQQFNVTKQSKLLVKAEHIITMDAPWIFVAHDLNLRALSPRVKGFIEPQTWFADLTTVSMS